jgi:hypothetical protein
MGPGQMKSWLDLDSAQMVIAQYKDTDALDSGIDRRVRAKNISNQNICLKNNLGFPVRVC